MSHYGTFRKSLIAAASAASLAALLLPAGVLAQEKAKVPAVSQTDGITIYGRLDMVLESSDDGAFTRPVVQQISSRIGFKGQRTISSDLSGIMQIESGLSPEDGKTNVGTFATRNTYAGLKSKSMGSMIVGLYDMPLKKLEGFSAPVWGSAEAMEIIIHGKGTNRTATPFNNFHTRQANVIQYWSPKFAEMEVKIAYSPDEINGATAVLYRKPIYGGSFEFDNGTFNAGIATETQVNAAALDKNITAVKAVAGMRMGDATFGVAYSQIDNSLTRKTDNWMIAGSYTMGPVIFKGNYGKSSESASAALDALTMVGLEADYKLDKFTTLYTYYSAITNDDKARGRFEAGDNKYSPVAGGDPKVFGLGFRYDF